MFIELCLKQNKKLNEPNDNTTFSAGTRDVADGADLRWLTMLT